MRSCMHPNTVFDTWIFAVTIVSWSRGSRGRAGGAGGQGQDPKAQVEAGCQKQGLVSNGEGDLAKDLVFEPDFHLSEILPLFPRSLLALREPSGWSFLVPPAYTTLTWGFSGPRCRSVLCIRLSWALTPRLCFISTTLYCTTNTPLFSSLRSATSNKNKQTKPSCSESTVLSALPVYPAFSWEGKDGG